MENERRLIDANALIKKFDGFGFGGENDGEIVLEAVAEAPTVDAVEVVHARWIDEDWGDWRCSKCRRLFTFDDYGDVHPLADCGFNYCPNCGAKMDGGNEDGKNN